MGTWTDIVPNWLSAVGTVSASGVAVWLAWGERRRAHAAEAERDELRAWTESESARLVMAWMEKEPGPVMLSGTQVDGPWSIRISNDAKEPIRNVSATVHHYDGESEESELLGYWIAIPAGERVVEWIDKELGDYDEPPSVTCRFTDGRGRVWERQEYGELDRVR